VAEDTPYTRTLARAALAVGGEVELAQVLEVSEGQLRAWLEGEETPPLQVFSAALDIVAKGR
jgi:DNA-binding transcriptional regulator YiaG